MSHRGPRLLLSAPASPPSRALCHAGQSMYFEGLFPRHSCPGPVTCTHTRRARLQGFGPGSVHVVLTEKEAAQDFSHGCLFPLTPSRPSSSFPSHPAKNSSHHIWAFPFPCPLKIGIEHLLCPRYRDESERIPALKELIVQSRPRMKSNTIM